MRHFITAALVAALCSCASNQLPLAESIQPTEAKPFSACAIVCKDGGPMIFAAQHICGRGANRQFIDTQLIGRVLDHWLTCWQYDVRAHRCELAREIPVADVELKSCHQVVSEQIASRAMSERGVHPGEDGHGDPLPPKN